MLWFGLQMWLDCLLSLILESLFINEKVARSSSNLLVLYFQKQIFPSLLPFIIINVSYVLALTLPMEGLCSLIYRLWCFEFPA